MLAGFVLVSDALSIAFCTSPTNLCTVGIISKVPCFGHLDFAVRSDTYTRLVNGSEAFDVVFALKIVVVVPWIIAQYLPFDERLLAPGTSNCSFISDIDSPRQRKLAITLSEAWDEDALITFSSEAIHIHTVSLANSGLVDGSEHKHE